MMVQGCFRGFRSFRGFRGLFSVGVYSGDLGGVGDLGVYLGGLRG